MAWRQSNGGASKTTALESIGPIPNSLGWGDVVGKTSRLAQGCLIVSSHMPFGIVAPSLDRRPESCRKHVHVHEKSAYCSLRHKLGICNHCVFLLRGLLRSASYARQCRAPHNLVSWVVGIHIILRPCLYRFETATSALVVFLHPLPPPHPPKGGCGGFTSSCARFFATSHIACSVSQVSNIL